MASKMSDRPWTLRFIPNPFPMNEDYSDEWHIVDESNEVVGVFFSERSAREAVVSRHFLQLYVYGERKKVSEVVEEVEREWADEKEVIDGR